MRLHIHASSPRQHRFVTASWLRFAFIGLILFSPARQTTASAESTDPAARDSVWHQVLDRMPDWWRRARRVEVHWVSDREMERLIADDEQEGNQRGDDSTIQGFYDRAKDDRTPSTITIRASINRDDATFVLSHEFAHMVWDEVLTRGERADYRQIWEDQRQHRRLVSRYAGESPEEGFAEAVASYLWQNEKLKRRDGFSYDFVSDLVHAAEQRAEQETSR